VPGIEGEKYRLYFDGIMNWNKLGFLSRKFAEHGAAVLAGRYIHNAFWQEPHLIDVENPLRGMAQHYLLCPTNHGTRTLDYLTLRDCREYDVDGIVFHSTRTCRAFTGPQRLLARSAQNTLGIPSIFFEGDVADASFYKEEILESRLVAMLEQIDVRRQRGEYTGAARP
jgi:benzoyl-CoA reductase/2-hydroxyglutaryl-CoA dehydratase subunit BcrC/BadD/HgdB